MKKVVFLLLIIPALAFGYVQPTTLCGYALDRSIFDIDPSIITYYGKRDERCVFASPAVLFFTDLRMNIVSITAYGEGVKINELGITLPCEAKKLFEFLGTPTEITNEDYVFSYDIGSTNYVLHATKSEKKPEIIDRIQLLSGPSVEYYKKWLKQTHAR